jgi:hypothetical protein
MCFTIEGPVTIHFDAQVAQILDANGVSRATFYLKQKDD